MRCRNCGKSGLANIHAIRAHLRSCPRRGYRDEAAQKKVEEGDGPGALAREVSSWPPKPYTQVPLSGMPWFEELERTGLSVGVPPKVARITANYLGYVCDLEDPVLMWRKMRNCPWLFPADGLRWLQTWCSMQLMPFPWEIVEMGERESE